MAVRLMGAEKARLRAENCQLQRELIDTRHQVMDLAVMVSHLRSENPDTIVGWPLPGPAPAWFWRWQL